MKKQTLKKTQIITREGYYFDGTIECARQIYLNVKEHRDSSFSSFNLKYDFDNDTFRFDWGSFKINAGDFVCISHVVDDRVESYIEVCTPHEIERWGFELQE